jgi:sulfatase maturation enzyme AslB (radical SAM superfamily)
MKKYLIVFYDKVIEDWIYEQSFPIVIANHAFFKNNFSLEENTEILNKFGLSVVLVQLDQNITVIHQHDVNFEEILNNILDKINEFGIDSLSDYEKKFLRSY